jgi:hypothetical protein
MSILIKNKEDREQQAQAQDDIDSAFEKAMQRKLNPLVRNIVSDFETLYSTTGQIVNTDNYKTQLEAILQQTYRKVNNEFSMTYQDDLIDQRAIAKTERRQKRLDKIIEMRNEVEPIIVASLLAWSQIQAPQQSEIITNTWGRIIRKRIDDSIAENILGDNPIDDVTIASKTKKPLTDELITHNELISMQEVQAPTGNAKFTEADELNKSLKSSQIITDRIEKTWQNVGINVRDAHRAANGQRKELNEPFLVGGELLMYPRDTSLGASLGNIMNCKCKSLYQ